MPTITQDKAIELIEKIVKKHGSQREAAKELDISVTFLSDILKRRRSISDQIARRLGYRRVVMFEKEESHE